MNIAIIGGGASGIITAYLLRDRHRVTIFERNAYLGGNVRTLNGNVAAPALSADLRLENGVLGFNQKTYPNFYRLMRELGIPMKRVFGSMGLYLLSERRNYLLAPADATVRSPWRYLRQTLRSIRPGLDMARHYRAACRLSPARLAETAVRDLLPANPTSALWLRGIKMSAFSMPFDETGALPVSISTPKTGSVWHILPDGIYSYMRRMLEIARPAVVLRAAIQAIRRTPDGVRIDLASGERLGFDRVVLAVTPGQVLGLLADAEEEERRRFVPWADSAFSTVAHTSTEMYQGFDAARFTNADVFFDAKTGQAGYNAYLSHLYGIATRLHFSYAHNLDAFIPAASVVDQWAHVVPRFTVEAVRTQTEIRAANGQRNTYFAGAYLYQGWHESAATAALDVAARL